LTSGSHGLLVQPFLQRFIRADAWEGLTSCRSAQKGGSIAAGENNASATAAKGGGWSMEIGRTQMKAIDWLTSWRIWIPTMILLWILKVGFQAYNAAHHADRHYISTDPNFGLNCPSDPRCVNR
jgi:hypothetical protein